MQKKHLRMSTLNNLENAAKEKLQHIQGGLKFTKKAAKNVDRYSHRRPWVVVSAFAFLAGIFGYFMGRK